MTPMRLMRTLLDSLQERRRGDDHDALDLITDEKQKNKAARMIDDQDKQFDDAMPQMRSAGGRGRGRP